MSDLQTKRDALSLAIDQFNASTKERYLASKALNETAAEYSRNLASIAVARLDGLPVTADDEAYGIRSALAAKDALTAARLRESKHERLGDEMMRAIAELAEARREALCASTVEEGA